MNELSRELEENSGMKKAAKSVAKMLVDSWVEDIAENGESTDDVGDALQDFIEKIWKRYSKKERREMAEDMGIDVEGDDWEDEALDLFMDSSSGDISEAGIIDKMIMRAIIEEFEKKIR